MTEEAKTLSWFGLKAGLLLGILFLCLHLAFYFVQNEGRPLELSDPDCYMWMIRSDHLNTHFTWYPEGQVRSNYPEGESVYYWSRWVDLSFFIPAKILNIAMPFKSALFTWGILYGPVILIVLMGLMGWLCGSLLQKRDSILFALLFFATQFGLHVACMAGRPDNHSLLLVFFLLVIMGVIYSLKKASTRLMLATAIFAGFAIEVSIQSLFIVGVLYALAYFAWVLRMTDHFRLLRIFIYIVPCSAFAFFLSARSPALWTTTTLDQLCWIYLLSMLIPCIVIELMWRWDISRTYLRITMPLAVSVAFIILFYAAFPYFFHGPYGQVDPEIKKIWFVNIIEIAPLISIKHTRWAEILLTIGASIPCLMICLIFIRDKSSSSFHRLLWIFWGLLILSHSVLTLLQYRWLYYVGITLVIPYTVGYDFLAKKFSAALEEKLLLRVLFKSCALLLFPTLSLVAWKIGEIQKTTPPSSSPSTPTETVPFSKLCTWLESEYRTPQHVLCFLDRSPELLWRTSSHTILGSPYHRNTAGIRDNYHFMTATDDAEAQALARKWHLSLIVICPHLPNANTFYQQKHDPSTLRERLLSYRHPEWLKPVTLPTDLAQDYLVYEVVLP